jgi:hypothetical protein
MSQFIDDFCNDLANINDNFLNINQITDKTMTKLFELEEQNRYDGVRYYLKIDGCYHKSFDTYQEAVEEYDNAVNFTFSKTVLLSKEVEL